MDRPPPDVLIGCSDAGACRGWFVATTEPCARRRVVLINGRTAYTDGAPVDGFGREPGFGRVLRAEHR